MATLRKRVGKRGTTWYLCWNEDGRECRQSLGRLTFQEADRIRRDKQYQLDRGIGSVARAPSFGQFCDDYLKWHWSEYPDSHRTVLHICHHWLIPWFGTLPLPGIKAIEAEAYKQARLSQPWRGEQLAAPTTVGKEIRTLHAILNKAVEWNIIAANPIRSVKPPRDTRDRPPPFYTVDQLEAIYGKATELHAAMWRLYVNTGMRRAEGLALRREHITAQGLQVLSTGESRTKSGRWRLIPINEAAGTALDRLLAAGGAYILPRMAHRSITRAFSVDAQAAGAGGTLHWLRHTFCSHLVMAGVPLRTVQALAGHASIATTEQYAHLAPGHLSGALERLRL